MLSILIVLLAILFCISRTLVYFTSHYRLTIAAKAGQLIHQPVEIGAASSTWHGLQPIIQLYHVTVFNNDHTNSLISADQLDVGINVWQSLFQRHVVLRTIMISGMNLIIRQSADGQWIINGMSNITSNTSEQNSPKLQDLLGWLSALRQVSLHDVGIDWYDPNDKLWSLYKLHLKLESLGNHYKLLGENTDPTK